MKQLNSREIAAVLAGLRLLQNHIDYHPNWIDEGIWDIFNNGGELSPLSINEIDTLCERINSKSER